MKEIHYLLKKNTSDENNPLTPVGQFKTRKNVIGSLDQIATTPPAEVKEELNL